MITFLLLPRNLHRFQSGGDRLGHAAWLLLCERHHSSK